MKKITFFENKELNHILNEMETLSTTEEKEAFRNPAKRRYRQRHAKVWYPR